MNKEKYLYLVFSVTPYKVGKVIRFFTNYNFNHVSVSLSPDLKKLYTFARRYRNVPFCGGFVTESPLRFKNKGRLAEIKVFKIPVSEESFKGASDFLFSVKSAPDLYVYNMLSAIFSLVRLKIRIPQSFTCAEFAAEMLSRAVPEESFDPDKFYSIKDLGKLLEKYTVYEGSVLPFLDENLSWGHDLFSEEKSFIEGLRLSASSNLIMLKSLFSKSRQ